jgi:EH domain-containing protein 1
MSNRVGFPCVLLTFCLRHSELNDSILPQLVKRVRKVKTLAYIIGHLKAQMPAMMGKEKKQQKLISELPTVFRTIMKKYNLSPGDFPDIASFSSKLQEVKFAEFSTLKEKQLEDLDRVLNNDIPLLMEQLPSAKDSPETLRAKLDGQDASASNAYVPIPTRASKFGKKSNEGESNPFGPDEDDEDKYWALQDSADRLRKTFESLGPQGGFLDTKTARDVLTQTGLSKDQLRKIWNLSDIDKDGYFDHEEYVVAMFLVDAVVQKGRPIPATLPMTVVPPGKRALIEQRKANEGGM